MASVMDSLLRVSHATVICTSDLRPSCGVRCTHGNVSPCTRECGARGLCSTGRDWNIRRKHESVAQVRTLVAKLIGVVFSIAAGLIAGKEGPFVHGGGIVGGGIGSMGSQ